MANLQSLIRLSKQLSPLAAQLVRKALLSAPNIPLATRIALDSSLREQAQGNAEITPAELMALLEPKKHGVSQDRLVAHLQALHFLQACTDQQPSTGQTAGNAGIEPNSTKSN